MSYCRWIDGDVYMYHDIGGYIRCCCSDDHRDDHRFNSRAEALFHLVRHRRAGDEVPQHAIDALKEEVRAEHRGEIPRSLK